jgi:hypothetical protein
MSASEVKFAMEAGDFKFFGEPQSDGTYVWSRLLLNTPGITVEPIELCELPKEVAAAFVKARVNEQAQNPQS